MSLFGQKAPGLSINTNSANSLFNTGNAQSNASQAPAAGGLFGSSTASKPGGLFGSTATTAASAGTLFGTSTATTTQGGGVFGNTASAPASNAGTLFGGSAAQGGSLFGQNKPQTSQPQQGGGLFGQSTTAQGGTAQGGSGSFGQSTAQLGSSLFGQPAQQQQQQQQQPQQQQTGNMFPNIIPLFNQAQQPQPQQGQAAPSLFNPQPRQNHAYNVFGSTINRNSSLFPTQDPQRSAFSRSIGQYTEAAKAIPGVRIDLSNLKPTTRFEDLHDSLQTEIKQINEFITAQTTLSDECSILIPQIEHSIATIPGDVDFCDRKLKALQHSLETDAAAIDEARTLTRTDAEDARRSFKAIHALKMPAQYHAPGLWHSSLSSAAPGALADGETVDSERENADLVRYFAKQTEEMEQKLDVFKKNLSEVQDCLSGVETQMHAHVQSQRSGRGNNAPKTADEKIRELGNVLTEFEGGILTVAGSVGGVREQVNDLILNDSKLGRWGRR